MKKKHILISAICILGIIFGLLSLYLCKKSEYVSKMEKIHSSCKDSIESVVDSLTEYKKEHQEKSYESATMEVYALSKVYEFLPEDSYDTDLHLLIHQIWLKLYLEEELTEKELDILIEGFTLLSDDIEDTEAYYKLLRLFNEIN